MCVIGQVLFWQWLPVSDLHPTWRNRPGDEDKWNLIMIRIFTKHFQFQWTTFFLLWRLKWASKCIYYLFGNSIFLCCKSQLPMMVDTFFTRQFPTSTLRLIMEPKYVYSCAHDGLRIPCQKNAADASDLASFCSECTRPFCLSPSPAFAYWTLARGGQWAHPQAVLLLN